MNGFDLSTISNCYVGGTQASAIYYGSQLIWPTGPQPSPYQSEYLTFTSLEDDNIITWNNGIQTDTDWKTISISTNNGLTWTSKTSSYYGNGGTTLATLNTNDKLLIKGLNTRYGYDSAHHNYFSSTKQFNVSGNIMSLLYGDNFINQTTLTNPDTFYLLFTNCTNLISAENLILPATTLMLSCYGSMFNGCSNLTTAPNLPATTLVQNCYTSMFHNCTNLTIAPNLPATTLAYKCYTHMFSGCDNLTTAPALPATTLAESCYSYMFNGCLNLTAAPALPATTLAEYCYDSMFQNCKSLTTAPELLATTLVKDCYVYMFSGCSSLSNITCLASTFATNSTYYWVSGVSSSGTFIKNPNTTVNAWGRGRSNIPNDWTVQDYNG